MIGRFPENIIIDGISIVNLTIIMLNVFGIKCFLIIHQKLAPKALLKLKHIHFLLFLILLLN